MATKILTVAFFFFTFLFTLIQFRYFGKLFFIHCKFAQQICCYIQCRCLMKTWIMKVAVRFLRVCLLCTFNEINNVLLHSPQKKTDNIKPVKYIFVVFFFLPTYNNQCTKGKLLVTFKIKMQHFILTYQFWSKISVITWIIFNINEVFRVFYKK